MTISYLNSKEDHVDDIICKKYAKHDHESDSVIPESCVFTEFLLDLNKKFKVKYSIVPVKFSLNMRPDFLYFTKRGWK